MSKKQIKLFCKEYAMLYNVNVFPIIKKKIRMKPVACITAKEAYNKNYRIYFNRKHINDNVISLRATTFHEMTHIADSLIFQNLPYNDFLKIMNTYSECHAAEIELNARLQYCSNPITIQIRFLL